MSAIAKPSAELAAFLDGLPPPAAEIACALREAVLTAAPGAEESIKWGVPSYALKHVLCSIAPAHRYVRLQFWRGAELHDPRGLVEGTGKRLRHVKVRSAREARAEPLRILIRQARALDSA